MRSVMVGIVLSVVSASWVYAQQGEVVEQETPAAPQLTREYLLAHGFIESADDHGKFSVGHVRLRDVSRDLGISGSSLRPTVNQPPHSDVRTAEAPGVRITVGSEVRDSKGRVLSGSLDDPDAMCSVTVSLDRSPKREYLKTDGVPRLRIRCVSALDVATGGLRVVLELATTGKRPLAISQRDFHSSLTGGKLPKHLGFGVVFPEETPQTIIVSPSQPMVLNVALATSDGVQLVSGEYAVRIRIAVMKFRGPQRFDYEWQGREYVSNEFKFVIR